MLIFHMLNRLKCKCVMECKSLKHILTIQNKNLKAFRGARCITLKKFRKCFQIIEIRERCAVVTGDMVPD